MTIANPDTTPAVAGVLDIRSHFPALERREGGVPVAYFDGPGGTQVPREVAHAVSDYLLAHNANTHWAYPTSQETDRMLSEARAAVGDFLGAAPSEVAFGANMTTLTYHLARALGRGWGPGDEIVVTELDHHANVDPWRALERERSVRLRWVPFNLKTGELDWAAYRGLLGPRTRLVAIGAASNALGTVNDLATAIELAHGAGALVFVDAVHYAAHARVNVHQLGCDFLACSAYKFYGPHVGILCGRHDLLRGLDVPKLAPAPDSAPERLETGTQNHEGIAGTLAAITFLAELSGTGPRTDRLTRSLGELHRRGQALVERLWRGLSSLAGVRLYGPPPDRPRTPTVAFTVQGHSSQAVAVQLAARGVFVSHGDFYAATVAERYGVGERGFVRAGCACYTTADEVDRLIEGVRTLK